MHVCLYMYVYRERGTKEERNKEVNDEKNNREVSKI